MSEHIATVSSRIAQAMAESKPLVIRDFAKPSPGVKTAMMWHRRFDNHAAHIWLRKMIASVSATIDQRPRKMATVSGTGKVRNGPPR